MAYIKSKTLFFTTSPRTPWKMIPELEVLKADFEGKAWDADTQVAYIKKLSEGSDFQGKGSDKDMALSARDRINRAPKSLGFVDLKPVIKLTDPGKRLISGKRPEEILLRQLLKYQIPSPYHMETKQSSGVFWVKPYLEIFRLIYQLGFLSFDELMAFGMQLTHYRKFEAILAKIKRFRRMEGYDGMSDKIFKSTYLYQEVVKIYQDDIDAGNTKTRESKDASVHKFVWTKARNMRDYADACFRYLRATGMVEISQKGQAISIMPEKMPEVEFLLKTIDRDPVYVDDEQKYKEYLFDDVTIPILYSDDRERLLGQLEGIAGQCGDFDTESTETLKDILADAKIARKSEIINEQSRNLKEHRDYADVMAVFDDIRKNEFYDVPLMLEWNTWRALMMMDGIAYFYALHNMNIAFYGGKSVIVPMELDVFVHMVEQAHEVGYLPSPQQVRKIFEYSAVQAARAKDENEWYANVKELALNWLHDVTTFDI